MNRPHTSSDAEALRRRAARLRHDAEDQQPWRCVACGEAVSRIRHSDCACTRTNGPSKTNEAPWG